MNELYPLLIVIAGLLNAAVLIIEKYLLRSEHALSFSASITLVIAIMSLVLLPFANLSITMFQMLMVIIYSITLALSYWMSARLFRHGSLSTGSPLYNVLPIIVVVVLAFIFLGEVLSIARYLAIIAIVVVAFMLVFASNKKRDMVSKKLYDNLIIIVAADIGINYVLLKYILYTMSVYTFIPLASVFTLLIVTLFLRGRNNLYKKETLHDIHKFIVPLVIMGALTLTYRILLYTAVATVPISIATPLLSAVVVMATVMSGGLFFGEHRIRTKVILSAIMLIAAYILVAL